MLPFKHILITNQTWYSEKSESRFLGLESRSQKKLFNCGYHYKYISMLINTEKQSETTEIKVHKAYEPRQKGKQKL